MAKLWGEREVWLILHIFLLLPVSGRTSTTRSAESSSKEICDKQPMHKCNITIYDIKDIVHANYMYMYTVFKCPDDDSDITLHWSLNPCCSGDYIDTVVNLTSGVRTKIDCSLAPTNQSYTWRMEAPPGLRVLLTVPEHHVCNIIEATDEDDRGNPYIFAANSFAEDGDYFLSSSEVVYMNATLECSDPTQFSVIGEVVNITNTIEVTGDLKDCTIPQHDAEVNHWDTENVCQAVFYNDSCYHFISGGIKPAEAKRKCKDMMSGFHLVFIDSSEEQDFLAMTSASNDITANCKPPHNCDYWIGIKQNGDRKPVWMDGSAIIYTNFNMPIPSEQCFGLQSEEKYMWESYDCADTRVGSICEREQGYHGTASNDRGCAAFKGTLPAVLTNIDDGILLKFSYYIKTFDSSDNSGAAMLWTGTYIIPCNPSNFSLSSQSDLRLNVSCRVSSDSWAVNIQASGEGLVKISDMQLFIVGGTTASVTIGPVPSSTTLVSTTSPTTSPSQRITASTGMTGSVGTAFSSSSPPSTTSPSSSSSRSTMPMSTPSIDIHSSSPSIITTESSTAQDRSSASTSLTGSVGTTLSSSSPPTTTSPSSSSSMSTMTRSPTTRTSTPSLDTYSGSPPIITTESSKAQDRSSGRKKSVLPIVVVLLIVLLIALIVGVFWYKRRGKLATSKRNQQSRSPNGTVQNPTFENDDGEHEYAEYKEKTSTKGTTRISSSEDAQQHIYSDLPASASKDNNGVIYNEVGEQDYNVPFGGKEMGDYHEYNLPDSEHGRSNAKDPTNEDPYQELSEDGKRCSPKGTQGTTRISSSEDAQQHIYSDLPASAPNKDSNGVIYNEVGEQDYNVPFGGKEMGDYHEYNLPDTDHGRSNVKDPTNEDSYQELSEDGKRCSPKGAQGTTRISSTEDAQQHIYTDLPTSASKDSNGVIYNEVGEQDYNVPFDGKEMGDYHEYNLPDSDHGRSNAKKPTNEDSYQELSEDGKRCSPKGIERHALPGMTEKAIESQSKVGDPSRTGGHAYQDLRKDDGGYTSLGLPQKPVTKVTAAELENSYQALHADGPDYFTLKPNETKPSPNPDNLQNSTYQPLRQEPAYAILESEQSDNPAKPVDNTYQSLLKDANNHADLDIEHRKDNTPKQGQSDPYDVLQRGPKTKQLSLDGYGSLGPTAKEEEEHDYESPEGKPKATTDYEDPIQDNSVADGPYDSLQRNAMPEPPRSSPSLANRAVDDGDNDDYETPDRSNDDPTDANYQTLDNRQEKSDSGNEEYSHLQRSLGAKLSHDPTGVSDNSNQYGTLSYGNSADK